ncbi:MAG: hypothetical protein ACREFX_09410 [Opitutaceae bacterium]
MYSGAGFIFYLDTPVELPGEDESELGGWIAGVQELADICLLSAKPVALRLVPRPDVVAAFPRFPHIAGFSGRAKNSDVKNDALNFSFLVGANLGSLRSLCLTPRPP